MISGMRVETGNACEIDGLVASGDSRGNNGWPKCNIIVGLGPGFFFLLGEKSSNDPFRPGWGMSEFQ